VFEIVENETVFGKSGVEMSARRPAKLTDGFHVLCEFLPSDSDTVCQIRQGQLPSISLPNRLLNKHPVILRCVFRVVECFVVYPYIY
jgi:hypothetical protein